MLTVTWHPLLIATSYLVAFIASFVALESAAKMTMVTCRAALFWRLAGGVTLGIGIWSMHFIRMLSMNMPMPMSYHLTLTIASLLIAIFAATLGLNIAVSGNRRSPLRLAIATLILGSGVVAMHYTGMAALMLHAPIRWNSTLVALSVLIAMLAAGVALWLAFHLRNQHKGVVLNRIGAAAVMGLAICAMHYTGMHAAHFPHESQPLPGGIGETGLAMWVSVTTLTLLGIMLVVSMVDSHFRALRLMDNLRQLNKQLEQQARFDPLTGLANLYQMDLSMQACLRDALQKRTSFAVLFINVDRFKEVNDVWGHYVGDALLMGIAQRIAARLTPEMILARLGGDAFILLLPDSDAEQAASLAAALLETMRPSLTVGNHQINVTLSMGISVWPEHGETLHELTFKADAAMSHVKQEGRNGWAVWRPEMSGIFTTDPGFHKDLNLALERQQFELWYQPLYLAERHEIHGFEALLRWNHPEKGVLTPNAFLPTLEKTGLIIPVGVWAIEQACRQLRFWTDQGFHHWTLSYNLSAVQFEQPDIFEVITRTLAKYDLAPSRLILEVTESTALKNLERSIELLNAFSHAGFTISLDDFGTGYSNLLMLSVLPARELKIDKSFIASMPESDKSRKIVLTIINVARSLEMKVVAEGIENEDQKAMLIEMDCDYLQGYLFSRPIPASQVPWRVLQDKSDRQIIAPAVTGYSASPQSD